MQIFIIILSSDHLIIPAFYPIKMKVFITMSSFYLIIPAFYHIKLDIPTSDQKDQFPTFRDLPPRFGKRPNFSPFF